jgi:hypothetical protein
LVPPVIDLQAGTFGVKKYDHIRQMQVDAQVDEQVGRAPPYDHWVLRIRPHLSSTYWLKYAVQKETL